MTKVLKLVAGSGLAAVLGLLLVGLSGVMNAHEAKAESPPNPPARFAGSVLVDGKPAPAGTRIEARIGSATCGLTTTFSSGSDSRYALDSPALDPGATPNCGTDSAVVSFYIGDQKAAQTGSWKNYQLNVLDLTYTTPSPTPTASATATTAAPSATPRPPVTGTGTKDADGSGLVWVFAMLGLGAVAFGVGGLAVARRRG